MPDVPLQKERVGPVPCFPSGGAAVHEGVRAGQGAGHDPGEEPGEGRRRAHGESGAVRAPTCVPPGADPVCCSPRGPLKGTMICRGKLILMADADGATKFSDIEKAESALHALSPKPV